MITMTSTAPPAAAKTSGAKETSPTVTSTTAKEAAVSASTAAASSTPGASPGEDVNNNAARSEGGNAGPDAVGNVETESVDPNVSASTSTVAVAVGTTGNVGLPVPVIANADAGDAGALPEAPPPAADDPPAPAGAPKPAPAAPPAAAGASKPAPADPPAAAGASEPAPADPPVAAGAPTPAPEAATSKRTLPPEAEGGAPPAESNANSPKKSPKGYDSKEVDVEVIDEPDALIGKSQMVTGAAAFMILGYIFTSAGEGKILNLKRIVVPAWNELKAQKVGKWSFSNKVKRGSGGGLVEYEYKNGMCGEAYKSQEALVAAIIYDIRQNGEFLKSFYKTKDNMGEGGIFLGKNDATETILDQVVAGLTAKAVSIELNLPDSFWANPEQESGSKKKAQVNGSKKKHKTRAAAKPAAGGRTTASPTRSESPSSGQASTPALKRAPEGKPKSPAKKRGKFDEEQESESSDVDTLKNILVTLDGMLTTIKGLQNIVRAELSKRE